MTANIVVTGASRGIGAILAIELARRGHVVGCLSRKGRGPEDVEIAQAVKEKLVPLQADVVDTSSVAAALGRFERTAGRVSGLVNNAGVHIEAPSSTQPLAQFEEVLRTNTTATFAACQLVYPYMHKSGGLIVNIGSFYDKLGVRRNAAYCASKAAVAAITRCLAAEWASKGILVVNVAPGYIETDLNKEALASDKLKAFLATRIPVGGPGKPIDIAKFVAALFDEQIPILTGETIYLDGGQGMAL